MVFFYGGLSRLMHYPSYNFWPEHPPLYFSATCWSVSKIFKMIWTSIYNLWRIGQVSSYLFAKNIYFCLQSDISCIFIIICTNMVRTKTMTVSLTSVYEKIKLTKTFNEKKIWFGWEWERHINIKFSRWQYFF